MKRTLYIHVGPSKTGTSAIQSVFRNLRDERLTYPQTGRWADGSHNLLSLSIKGEARLGNVEIPPMEEVIAEISAEISAAPNDCLISSEGLNHWGRYSRLLTALEPATRDFDEVRPIVTLRHPVERCASEYNQAVKDPMDGKTSLPDDYLLNESCRYFLSPMVRNWLDIAPNVSLLPYHPASSLVQRFCGLIGHADLAPRSAPQLNKSLASVGLALVLLSNRHLTDADSRGNFFQRMLTIDWLRPWNGPSFPFSREAVEKAMSSTFREDLEQLKSGHGIDFMSWSMPQSIALTEPECAIVRNVAKEILPSGPKLDADIDAVLAVFRKPGTKLSECDNSDPKWNRPHVMRISRGSERSSKKRTLYIHVGPSKTGTSAIQSSFQDSRDERLKYPKAGRWQDGSHNLLSLSINGVSRFANIDIPPKEDIIAEISSEISMAPHDCLISSNSFNDYGNYSRLLESLAPATRDFYEIRPILTLRHPLERCASIYNQVVSAPMHGETALPDDYLLKEFDRFFPSLMVRIWRDIAPNILLLPYHPASSLVERFCDLIGHPDLAPRSAPQKKRSLAGVGLALFLLSNRHLTDIESRRNFFQRMRTTDGLPLWRGPSFPFSQEAVDKAMSSAFREDLEKIKSEHGIDLLNWSMPKTIALTEFECTIVRDIAYQHLLPGPELDADMDAILTAFRGPNPKL